MILHYRDAGVEGVFCVAVELGDGSSKLGRPVDQHGLLAERCSRPLFAIDRPAP
jgi:hypothetical protein